MKIKQTQIIELTLEELGKILAEHFKCPEPIRTSGELDEKTINPLTVLYLELAFSPEAKLPLPENHLPNHLNK